MASVGPADMDPSAGRPTEHMLMPTRHGGAPFPPSWRSRPGPPRARGFAPSPRDGRPPMQDARAQGASGASRSREVPLYDRATGQLIGYKAVVDPSPSYSQRGYGASAPRPTDVRMASREFDEYEPPATASYARGGAGFAADDSYVDERWGRPEAPTRIGGGDDRAYQQPHVSMRGGAMADEDEQQFAHGGAAYDEAREVDSILSSVKKTLMEQRRARTAGRAAPESDEYDARDAAPAATMSRRGRAEPEESHTFAKCEKGGCHACMSRHPGDCECRSCSRSTGRAAAPATTNARPQKSRTTTRGPRPQDF